MSEWACQKQTAEAAVKIVRVRLWILPVLVGFVAGCSAPPPPASTPAPQIVVPTATPFLVPAPSATPMPEATIVVEPTPVQAPETLTITPSSLITLVSSKLDNIRTEQECLELKDDVFDLLQAVNQRMQRLQDMGVRGGEAFYLNYVAIVLKNLSEAVEAKRKAVIQVDPNMSRTYERIVAAQLGAANQASRLCPGSYTVPNPR